MIDSNKMAHLYRESDERFVAGSKPRTQQCTYVLSERSRKTVQVFHRHESNKFCRAFGRRYIRDTGKLLTFP